MADFLLYGAYGYTGELIAEAAADHDLDPLLSGRREEPLADLAAETGHDYRVVDLADTERLEDTLADVDVALNCAGPVKQTYKPLVEACIETGTHYLDITGEIDVFRNVAGFGEAAEDAGVMLMSGVGFDVVPTDCLAAHLHDRLPEATDLALGFDPKGLPSGGTLKTALEDFTSGGYVREGGQLTSVRPAHRTRRIDFGRGTRTAVAIPWGDVETAYHTTGIPNIEVFLGLPTPIALSLQSAGLFSPVVSPVLGSKPVQSVMQEFIDTFLDGPSDRARERNRVLVWGEATDESGARVVSRLETPGGYTVTRDAALEITQRALDGDAPAGYQTPAGAYGADLILEIDGTTREDIE